jgi:uncharacterized protein (TIGR03435 family)
MSAEYLSPVLNHLWQSTVFAAVAGTLVLVLRRAQARTRYAVWLAASVKFLLPFALFMALGSRIHWPSARAVVHAQWSAAVTQASQPFTDSVTSSAAPIVDFHAVGSVWIPVLALIWGCGFAVVMCLWFVRWRRIRATVRVGRPLALQMPIHVLSSAALLEPSIFGIFRPVLLLPEGIEERLTGAQLEAVYAHELCHMQKRDNLAAALHMLVEALFWFHPLVWWLERRLIEERERACDEAVLEAGNRPQDYAESILEVCKLCLASPLSCASGVCGADLKKRIETIMNCRIGRRLNTPKKVLLVAVGALAVAAPVAIGLLNPARAQEQPAQSFEVASIKPSDPASRGISISGPGGGITAKGITTKGLIENAYDVHDFQIAEGPNWIDSDHYDISAKSEDSDEIDSSHLTPKQLEAHGKLRHARLQALLAERFQLKLHRVTKNLPVYALVVARSGPKLQPAKGSDPRANYGMRMGPGQLTATSLSTELLAANLSNLVDRVVLNKTGLEGYYDFTLNWTPDRRVPEPPDSDQPTADANGPSLFTALQEQLGLRLVPQKGPVEILMIDHIEKPSPN